MKTQRFRQGELFFAKVGVSCAGWIAQLPFAGFYGVHIGQDSIFICLFDGYGGPEAATYFYEHAHEVEFIFETL